MCTFSFFSLEVFRIFPASLVCYNVTMTRLWLWGFKLCRTSTGPLNLRTYTFLWFWIILFYYFFKHCLSPVMSFFPFDLLYLCVLCLN